MILGLGLACLGGLVWVAMTKTIQTGAEEGLDRIRLVQEGVCVVLIVVAVVILRLTACITEEGAASILSGIIGYVLGQAVSKK
jgi:hypothetical protein